jgi:hypothetical protein
MREMEVVAQMKVAALAGAAHELPPTTSACGMFGGCPFAERCGLTIGDMVPKKGSKTMGNAFLKGLKDKQAKKGKSNGVPASTLPPDAPTRETPVAETKGPPAEPPAETKAEAPKKKRGRPKGSTKKKTTTGDFTLYVDCAPEKDVSAAERPVLFEDWFHPMLEQMNEQARKENQMHYLQMGFGPSKAMVAVAVQELSKELPSEMVLHTSSAAGRDALDSLIPHAARVVRAMRG